MNLLVSRDLQRNWHPCAQMKDYERFPPLLIKRAYGSYIETVDGCRLIDATASWWCKSLGHHHPVLMAALQEQLQRFEHVMFAHTTYPAIIELSEQLAKLTNTLHKVMYASDGSCAVEMALKMSLHSRYLTGESHRNRFMALQNAYHGETGLALSVSDLGIYRKPYESALAPTIFLTGIPYVANKHDPVWQDCSDYWPAIEVQLEKHAHSLTAIIVEPIIQAAAGMLIYSADFLKRLRLWTQHHGIHLIADEIMTGFYRTGLPLTCHHAAIEPDFLCLGKGLTSGVLPLSAMLTSEPMYRLFYADYEQGKAFLHSHTHSGNALAVSVALACQSVYKQEQIAQQVTQLERLLPTLMQQIADNTKQLTGVRSLGAVVAADLVNAEKTSRLGFRVYQTAAQLGALMRPLGDTLYWTHPLNIPTKALYELQETMFLTLQRCCKNL